MTGCAPPTSQQLVLLDRVIEFLRNRPDLHQQDVWLTYDDRFGTGGKVPVVMEQALSCNTPGCMAGWTAMFAGQKVLIDTEDSWVGSKGTMIYAMYVNGEPIEDWAADALAMPMDFPDGDGDSHIFNSRNTLADLERWQKYAHVAYESGRCVEDVANENGEYPED